MELSPEQRKRIYEEEKARVEEEQKLEKEKQEAEALSTTNLALACPPKSYDRYYSAKYS